MIFGGTPHRKPPQFFPSDVSHTDALTLCPAAGLYGTHHETPRGVAQDLGEVWDLTMCGMGCRFLWDFSELSWLKTTMGSYHQLWGWPPDSLQDVYRKPSWE